MFVFNRLEKAPHEGGATSGVMLLSIEWATFPHDDFVERTPFIGYSSRNRFYDVKANFFIRSDGTLIMRKHFKFKLMKSKFLETKPDDTRDRFCPVSLTGPGEGTHRNAKARLFQLGHNV